MNIPTSSSSTHRTTIDDAPASGAPIPVQDRPFNAETPMHLLANATTPTSGFYVRNHYDSLILDASTYRLAVGGCVNKPLILSLGQLKQMAACRSIVTMECAGNGRSTLQPRPAGVPWRFGAAGTAEFAGVPLRTLLESAGVKSTAVDVVLAGGDSGPASGDANGTYSRSLAIDHAMNGDILLAWEMNGEPLTPVHGFPLRVVVPRWYAMSSVKWLTRIDVLDRPFDGFWQVSQYLYINEDGTADRTPVSRMRVRSIIATPGAGDNLRCGPVVMGGTAWSGEGGISSVKVSTDGGESWAEARLLAAAGAWGATPWRAEWRPDRVGEYELLARATDTNGNTQPLMPRSNQLGYGNNSVHRVRVIVVG